MKTIVMIAAITLAWLAPAEAGISLNQTRIVFMADKTSGQITVRNSDDSVYLVQAAVLDEQAKGVSRDFIVTPPIFRLEGKNENILRIMRTGGDFVNDRESLRYFMVRAIPASSKPLQQQGSALSIALGTQIKLFYRPLKLQPAIAQSYQQLTARQQGNQVVVHNPTPYYQSFAQVRFDGKEMNFSQQPQMIAPFSDVTFQTRQPVHYWQWSCINDYGGESELYRQTL